MPASRQPKKKAATAERRNISAGPFGRYVIEKTLGAGAMGTVYLARDTELERQVALKIPKLPKHDSHAQRRFQLEARAAAGLRHPHICPVYDVGEQDGMPFLSMAYIDGQPLSAMIQHEGISPAQAAAFIRKVADGMHDAHEHGIVHRDLKPDNIMVDRRGEPVVMDFGLAFQTDPDPHAAQVSREGLVVGTPAYMSPEQVDGRRDEIGPRSDIYSLGVIFYELLTGRLPFAGSITAILAQIITQDPTPPSSFLRIENAEPIPAEVEEICLRMMHKDREQRFQSMRDVVAALESCESAASTATAFPSFDTASAIDAPFVPTEIVPAPKRSVRRTSRTVARDRGRRTQTQSRKSIRTQAHTRRPSRKKPPKRPSKLFSMAWQLSIGVPLVAIALWFLLMRMHDQDPLETVAALNSGTPTKTKTEVPPFTNPSLPKKTNPEPTPSKAPEPSLKTTPPAPNLPGLNPVPLKPAKPPEDEKPVDPTVWQTYFQNSLSGWMAVPRVKENLWRPAQGTLTAPVHSKALTTSSRLWTVKTYENFVIDLEYRLGPDADAGVFLRSGVRSGYWPYTGYLEVTLKDSPQLEGNHNGGIWSVSNPQTDHYRSGQWNRLRIEAVGWRLRTWVNGKIAIDRDYLASHPSKRPETKNSQRIAAHHLFNTRGYIGLQSMKGRVEYRNVRIGELPPTKPPLPRTTQLVSSQLLDGHGNESITAMAYTPDGLLLSGGSRGILRLWAPQTGKDVLSSTLGDLPRIESIVVDDSGTRAYIAETISRGSRFDHYISQWRISDLFRLSISQSSPARVTELAMLAGQDCLAATSTAGLLKISPGPVAKWNSEDFVAGSNVSKHVTSVAVAKESPLAVLGSATGSVWYKRRQTRSFRSRETGSFGIIRSSDRSPPKVAVSDDGNLVVVLKSKKIESYRFVKSRREDGPHDYPIGTFFKGGTPAQWESMCLFDDGNGLIAGDNQGFISVAIAGKGIVERAFAHAGRVTKIDVAPDGKSFVTTGSDGLIRVWHMPDWSPFAPASK